MGKKDELVTKNMLDEAVDAILEGMSNLYNKHDNRLNSMDNRLESMDKKLDKIEGEVYFIKKDINDIKADLADTPTKSEFNKLKLNVEKHIIAS